ncbi:MAG: TrmH family RNA methyltransferase [Ignavibacteriae bacterium]|nr:TrmH family RNA methyltransferase [Ignavibacteriota bacterium]
MIVKKFNTVLYKVKSPQNVGMIIRSHVAFDGNKVIFVGYDTPWDFKQGSQAFSRKLEKKCIIENYYDENEFFEWSKKNNYKNIAIEIGKKSKSIIGYEFNNDSNLIVGNEGKGIPEEFLLKCDEILFIPQFGQVQCLNVAVSASLALFEFAKNNNSGTNKIEGSKFDIEL